MMGGDAPMVMAVMWVLTAITIVFVLVRLYTRVVILHQLGVDDYVYCLSGIMFFFYTLFMHISSNYGFGQDIGDLDIDDAVQAIFFEMIAQTFAASGMAVAKVSLGLFLLRVVVQTWHRVAIWTASLTLLAVSTMACIVLWIQCIPIQALYDPRVDGKCIVGITPFSIVLGSWCAAVDFFFAGFPWVFIWKLQMKQREKVIIAGSMSFGVVAGACGIVRTIELVGMSSQNYTKDTVALIVWSAAEVAVTMICIGIPVLRPLYRRIRYDTDDSTDRYFKHGQGSDGAAAGGFGLNNMDSHHHHGGDDDRKRNFDDAPPRSSSNVGASDRSTVTYMESGNNHSDEEILGPEFHKPAAAGGHGSRRAENDLERGEPRQPKP